MDEAILLSILKNIWILVLAVFSWIGKGMHNDIRKNEKDIAEHKLHVSENYIKKDVVERVHDRIDELANKEELEKLSDEIKEIRSDIKLIIGMVGANGRVKTTN